MNSENHRIFVPISIHGSYHPFRVLAMVTGFERQRLVNRVGHNIAQKAIKSAYRQVNNVLNRAFPRHMKHNGYATDDGNREITFGRDEPYIRFKAGVNYQSVLSNIIVETHRLLNKNNNRLGVWVEIKRTPKRKHINNNA